MVDSPLLTDLVGAADNLHDPTPVWNHKSVIIGWTFAVQFVALACAVARLYTRFFVVRFPWWDDLFVVLVLFCSMIGSITMVISTEHGMGEHLLLLSASEIAAYKKVFYIGFGAFLMSGIFVKLALLFQYIRLLLGQPNLMRVCRYLIIVTTVYGVIVTFLAWYATFALGSAPLSVARRPHDTPSNMFPCFPPAAMWQEAEPLPENTCFGFGSPRQEGLYATYVTTAVINLFLDLCCLAVPFPLFFCRDTTRRAKIGLTALLLLGGFVNGLALWRVVVSIDTKVGTFPTFDPTWYAPTSTMLAVFEVNASVVCASVPVFWPVLAAKFGDILVTHEVKVETSPRGGGGPGRGSDDEMQLWSPAGAAAEWRRSFSAPGVEDGAHHAKDAYPRAQMWPMDRLGRSESRVTAKHDRPKLEAVVARPGGGTRKWSS